MIQGCETAKEAWKILQTHFEGTSKVKSSQLNYLASKFENLKMEESESVVEFMKNIHLVPQTREPYIVNLQVYMYEDHVQSNMESA